jgi:hypothetical protein
MTQILCYLPPSWRFVIALCIKLLPINETAVDFESLSKVIVAKTYYIHTHRFTYGLHVWVSTVGVFKCRIIFISSSMVLSAVKS